MIYFNINRKEKAEHEIYESKENNITQIMSRKGNCYDTAYPF